ncbi:unnamed protein product [Owenia fusiformis]|uniref:Methyltransferase domain-containing protein n=1 Tax=Owenia fusiformis TaxID=6347 RepID=A0A8J1XTM1_OWEFU|nr:unnamed protein product [Owenia fusiformis]
MYQGADIGITCMANKDDIKTMKLYSNVDRIYNELKNAGYKEDDALKVNVLNKFDNYHYHGVQAVDTAAQLLDIGSESRVLDVGSGLGGPARYIAQHYNCEVTAVELQDDVNRTAKDLTERCGLGDKVHHVVGDFMSMEPGEDKFDVIVSWLVFLHIPDKRRLLQQCYDHLKPGGKIYIEDLYAKGHFSKSELDDLKCGVFCENLPSYSEYLNVCTQAGFYEIRMTELTNDWAVYCSQRYDNYVKQKERHVSVHNEQIYQEQKYFFDTMNKLFNGQNLGGCRIMATKPS